jgi:hypothetical protein
MSHDSRRSILEYRVFVFVLAVFFILSCSILPGINETVGNSFASSTTDSQPPGPGDGTAAPPEKIVFSPTSGILEPATTITPSETATVEILTLSPTFTPIPVTRFAVIGDYGLAGDPERDVANLILNWKPDFIITTGDNNYPDGRAETIDQNIGQYFHEYIHPYLGQYGAGAESNRFFPTLGNHDWNTDKAQAYFEYFSLPGNERYYDFVWGSVHLFAVDSDSREPDGVGRSSVQAMWLQERLAGSTSPWKIVYMHQPPYASAGDGSITWAQWPYKEWGASAVLGGHSHVYERIMVDGFPYFINGLGGGPRYEFDAPVPGSQVRFNDDYGALFVEATPWQITFQFVTRAGILIDSYRLEK